jgi:rhodanese-related sulfurtransferase
MSGKVLISPSELSELMKAEPVVLIDTRDPAIYAEAHIPGAVDVREVFTYLLTQHRRAWPPCGTPLRRLSVRRAYPARKRR